MIFDAVPFMFGEVRVSCEEGRDVVIPPAPDGPLCLVSSVLPRWDILQLEVTSLYHCFELDAFFIIEADVCWGGFVRHKDV